MHLISVFRCRPGAGLFSPDLTGMEEDLNTQQLLTMAQTLAETLRSSIPSLQGMETVNKSQRGCDTIDRASM